MPWPEIPAEQVPTFRPVTSLEDVETYSDFYYCFYSGGRYYKVPAPKIRINCYTGVLICMELAPIRRGGRPIRIPLDWLRELHITNERCLPSGPSIPFLELNPAKGPVDV